MSLNEEGVCVLFCPSFVRLLVPVAESVGQQRLTEHAGRLWHDLVDRLRLVVWERQRQRLELGQRMGEGRCHGYWRWWGRFGGQIGHDFSHPSPIGLRIVRDSRLGPCGPRSKTVLVLGPVLPPLVAVLLLWATWVPFRYLLPLVLPSSSCFRSRLPISLVIPLASRAGMRPPWT